MNNVFYYPGGKTYLSSWITDHFPDHHCYVEVFAGSAAVLVNKPESTVEVINDRDGDVVQFFEVLRERSDELVEWLRRVPYARDLHEQWATEWYAGDRPDDSVERAGRFFYLRYTQYGAKYNGKSGFRSSRHRSEATKFANSTDDLLEFADRFRDVQIENEDFEYVFDRFDAENTLFYCDPPYVQEGDELYTGDDFDHRRFIDGLLELEGDWCVSYTDVPSELSDYHISEKSVQYDKRDDGEYKDATERLVMSYDISERPRFDHGQQMRFGQT